ncbi:hypothetical protein SAMN05421684_7065 [Asanoa ishikariensis]|uniref:Uncharacterized protein n=1 Tax=Asanoa ishikariensis TaxID=137265 RepID=A0A1H3UDL0_9ACTN|nr:hypothetical protein [Asanoa ishikariensis]SDZ60552.1 hypothetical protein SAMN05421684_7065 [Asanoa ishikariensis]
MTDIAADVLESAGADPAAPAWKLIWAGFSRGLGTGETGGSATVFQPMTCSAT